MTINTQTDFRQLPLDSQSFVWQAGEIFRLPSGEQFRIEQPLKATVFLAVDLVAINKNAIASTELDRGRQAILRKEPRCIIKLAAADEFMLMSDADKAIAAARLAKEQFLLEKLQGPRVPQLLEAWDSNCLLNPEFNVRRPSPPFLILEYVDGQSLRELVSSDDLTHRAAQLAKVWQLLQDAVAALEQAGVLHRDLNPDNMRVRSQQLVLFDFGCASCEEFTSLEKAQTPFNAPEVRRGSQSQSSDHYSLAALSYWLFTGNEPDQLQRSALADVFQPLAKFWQQAMASELAERYGSLSQLDAAFKQALADFIRELNPVTEALARQQQLRLQHTELCQQSSALGLQLSAIGEQITALAAPLPDDWVDFKHSMRCLADSWQQLIAAQQQLGQQLHRFQAELDVELTDNDSAKAWLQARQQDPAWQNLLDELKKQLQALLSEEQLYQLEQQLGLPELQPCQLVMAQCQQRLDALKAQAAARQLSGLENTTLAALEQQMQLHQHLYDELSEALNEAAGALAQLADVLRLKNKRLQLYKKQQHLAQGLAGFLLQLQQVDFKEKVQATSVVQTSTPNWPFRLTAIAVLAGAGYFVWPELQSGIPEQQVEPVGSAQQNQMSQQAATEVPFIHGWSAEQVKALQQQAAKAVGMSVFFQEPLLNGQGLGPKMVVVPAGSFLMGCSEGDIECVDDEKPGKHKVTHAKQFAVSQHEITFDDWALCVSQGGCQSNTRPAFLFGFRAEPGQEPVINVSWHDAKEYVGWLSKATSRRYRLLTESEWEYTARAGSSERFAQFGNCIDTQQANYDSSYEVGSCLQSKTRQYLAKTQPVGQYPANNFGISDALGNVSEWTADCYQSSLTAIPTNGMAVGSGNCQVPVLRGGSWYNNPKNLRVSDRDNYTPGYRSITVGFRLARDIL
ncbi:SUMF1/EgtB/PvdO family nonheme iron enzyme [Rheinheimera sp. F8]|uniref:SUMF1/EgtB/PvdO family nonheme iron enzyme n=1 Tax=Rheinheimera sp. F8 TaxID=1763998 RepID=UPI000744CC82|nr:SUMF1/EgtB/PvdO family nonheme iron enzyme [Rheinheimera sp. F8]ALZ76697.1 hypothetical protein ATY27_13645 [Rheinheimera sp. F8]